VSNLTGSVAGVVSDGLTTPNGGSQIRTDDLKDMNLASFLAAPPRVEYGTIPHSVKPRKGIEPLRLRLEGAAMNPSRGAKAGSGVEPESAVLGGPPGVRSTGQ
jgi:hypothetical protein